MGVITESKVVITYVIRQTVPLGVIMKRTSKLKVIQKLILMTHIG